MCLQAVKASVPGVPGGVSLDCGYPYIAVGTRGDVMFFIFGTQSVDEADQVAVAQYNLL
jgi:hypothetical protein